MRKIKRSFKWLEIEKLHSGLSYQRPIDEKFVRETLDVFDINEVETVRVSMRINKNGEIEYRIIDGQHTVAILKEKGIKKAWCEIREELSDEEEHEWFWKKNTKSRGQVSSRLLNARINGKFDPDANLVVNSLGKAGYKIKAPNEKGGRGVINAGKSVFKIFDSMNESDFTKCMALHNSTFGEEKKALNASFLKGMSKFYITYKDKLDTVRFSTALSVKKVSVNEIIKEAESDKYTSDISVRYAKVLAKYYNKDLKNTQKRLKISCLED